MTTAEDVRREAKQNEGEMCTFKFRSVEKPLSIPERRAKILSLQKTFDELAGAHPSASNEDLRALLLEGARASDGTGPHSLHTFIVDTHPRMSKAIMTRNRPERVMLNIMRMLDVREKEMVASQAEGDRLVSNLQNSIFNECLINQPAQPRV